jgi:hypothetical protein
MTAASALSGFFDKMKSVNKGDVRVTRSTSFDEKSYVFSIYFDGPSVQGDVKQLDFIRGCKVPGKSISPYDSTYSLVTKVQGGATEKQVVRVNVDSGYIEGSLFTLSSPAFTTPCVSFGASSAELSTKLMALKDMTDQLLPFTLVSVNGAKSYTASSSIYGVIYVDSVIRISCPSLGQAGSYLTRVTQVLSGLVFVTDTAAPATDTSCAVALYHPEAFTVRRVGTGNTTFHTVVISSTADRKISSSAAGYYKIRLVLDGVAKSSSCLRYDASASDVQQSINSLGFDFNRDTVVDFNDNDHVIVTRSGDGSYLSGYGYSVGPIHSFIIYSFICIGSYD